MDFSQLVSVLTNLVLFLLVLTVIISIHELGHFLFAKRAGILIHEFSIGMGPQIVAKTKGDTKYAFRAIPLGGYVSMSGENGDYALISKGSRVGICLNEIGLVTGILLDQTRKKPLVTGEVVDFDLYGKNLSELFIEIKTDEGEVLRYQVTRDAKYYYGNQKELQITPEESSFASKTIWQRFLVLFMGPMMNFILALLLFIIIAAVQGKPVDDNVVHESSNPGLIAGDIIVNINGTDVEDLNDIRQIGELITDHVVPVVVVRNGVEESINLYVTILLQNFGLVNDTRDGYKDGAFIGGIGGKAGSAGVNLGDEITQVNGIPVSNWSDILVLARNYNQTTITLNVLRDGEYLTFTYDVLPEDTLNKLGHESVAVRFGFQTGYEFDFLYMLYNPFQRFGSSVTEMVNTIGMLFSTSSGVGVSDLAGPVGIFSLVSNAAQGGFINLLGFVAFLSVNIGLMNLLPIPALDGGRLLFLGYEAVSKKKIPAKVEGLVNNAFFILLLMLFVFVTWNDILRIFT
ncbi:RIP metalloprotease RseP [Acholeplasma laidlawii]|uniref:RIP metalloprotease RseP n=1 Tax=Acholeplasma laidlawii TaxID=2148 RepID=UPI0018C2AD46|nr:RIP metalloprotease RseP [Acholeplasma laidlawii]MBG0763007.1 RIP metalloprotease RseP [Acholeplasma laidlawii]